MPNVLILPRSADYSEEVWAEIRSKAISVLYSFFVDGVIPPNIAANDDDDDDDDDGDDKQIQGLTWHEEENKHNKSEKNKQSKRSATDSNQGTTNQKGSAQEFRSKQQQLYYQAWKKYFFLHTELCKSAILRLNPWFSCRNCRFINSCGFSINSLGSQQERTAWQFSLLKPQFHVYLANVRQ